MFLASSPYGNCCTQKRHFPQQIDVGNLWSSPAELRLIKTSRALSQTHYYNGLRRLCKTGNEIPCCVKHSDGDGVLIIVYCKFLCIYRRLVIIHFWGGLVKEKCRTTTLNMKKKKKKEKQTNENKTNRLLACLISLFERLRFLVVVVAVVVVVVVV